MLRCKHCPGCLSWKSRKLAARLQLVAPTAQYPAHVTLTSRPTTTWPQVMVAYDRLVKALRRRFPDLAYAAIKEEGHQTGMKHLHVIFLNWTWMDQAELSVLWAKYSKATNIFVQRIASQDVFSYVAKYAAKANANWKKGATFSRNWPKLPFAKDGIVCEKFTQLPANLPIEEELEDGTIIEYIAPDCHCFDCLLDEPPEPKLHLTP